MTALTLFDDLAAEFWLILAMPRRHTDLDQYAGEWFDAEFPEGFASAQAAHRWLTKHCKGRDTYGHAIRWVLWDKESKTRIGHVKSWQWRCGPSTYRNPVEREGLADRDHEEGQERTRL